MAHYVRLEAEVDAMQLQYQTLIQTPAGAISALQGDWIITPDSGPQYICTAEAFTANYRPIAKDGKDDAV